ncbi:MAG: hypothetical protein IT383_02240 [Deltaproteobacteria bacterium]|nr:hypothetical protein [Deltaproteobacteria bacterium]
MSVTSVKKAISSALADRHVTKAEIGSILKATKPTVSNVEAKALEDLHRMVTTAPSAPPGAVICFPTTIERGALDDLNKFIGEKNLPIGSHEAVMRDGINSFLSRARLGTPKTELPKSLSKLMELELHTGPQPLGGWQQKAYVDVAKKRFYLVETRPTLTDNTRVWGPLALPKAEAPAQTTVTPARADELRREFGSLSQRGLIHYKRDGLPLGVRMVEVPLMQERHPDGYAYSALIPVGALSPTAPMADPNKVKEFYVRRTGGIAGLTDYAGPFTV